MVILVVSRKWPWWNEDYRKRKLTWSSSFWKRSELRRFRWFWLLSSEYPVLWADIPWHQACQAHPKSCRRKNHGIWLEIPKSKLENPCGHYQTHYFAESLSWYSLDLEKQCWTPESLHNRFMPANSSSENGSVSSIRDTTSMTILASAFLYKDR